MVRDGRRLLPREYSHASGLAACIAEGERNIGANGDLPLVINPRNHHEVHHNRIGYSFCPFEHLRTCTSWRRFVQRCLGRQFRRSSRHGERDRLDSQRDNDRGGGGFHHFPEQHSKPIREHTRPQRLAERFDTRARGLRFGP
jgi:hypothetical protein